LNRTISQWMGIVVLSNSWVHSRGLIPANAPRRLCRLNRLSTGIMFGWFSVSPACDIDGPESEHGKRYTKKINQ
jgi:hypothetical protein